MCSRQIKSKRGNVFVLVLATIPLLVVALSFVINLGQLIHARVSLQSSVDRSAYAGAASLANSLNGIAKENWNIHRAWRDLDRDFGSDSQRNRSTAGRRYSQYEAERDYALEGMEMIVSESCSQARSMAEDTLFLNDSNATSEVFLSGCDRMPGVSRDEVERERVGFSYITGGTFIDPDDVDHGSYDALKYLRRRSEPAMIALSAEEIVRPLLLTSVFGEALSIKAFSAAQAFGGSIERFAQKGGERIEEAERLLGGGGEDDLYRMSLIPLRSMVVGSAR